MGHHIAAFVAKRPAATALSRALGNAPVYRLNRGEFLIVPVSDEAFDALVAARGPSAAAGEAFWRLTQGLAALAQECSVYGAIAFVETEYFGGVGSQGAAAWIAGMLVLAPTADERPGPINAALRAIGLAAEGGEDEFDTLGLGTVRAMDRFEAMRPER